MNHFLLLPLFLLVLLPTLSAQTVPGPVEKKMTDNICACISKLDPDSIKDKQSADKAFMDCFSQHAGLLVQVTEERKIELTDHPAMRQLGIEIGKNLLSQNCPGFMHLSMAMANGSDTGESLTGVTEGRLKRMDTRDFNYFVLTDDDNKEKSFIWLRQFPGSDSFINDASKLVGKKLRIDWQEMEVYVPSAKSYYSIKEVVGMEVLQ